MKRTLLSYHYSLEGEQAILPYKQEPSFKSVDKLPFIEYLPEDGKVKGVVIFFHGNGEKGGEMTRIEGLALPKVLKDGHEVPYAVLAFHLHSTIYNSWYLRILEAALDLVEIYKRKYNTSIVVPTGLSLGGIATLTLADIAYKRFGPNYFTAMGVCCANTSLFVEPYFKGYPIKWWHGDKDEVKGTPYSAATKFRDFANSKKLDFELITIPGGNHGSAWNTAYNPKGTNTFWTLLESVTPKEDPSNPPTSEPEQPIVLVRQGDKVYAISNGIKILTNISLQ